MIVAVVNPASGLGHTSDRITVVEESCTAIGRDLEIIRTAGPRDVVRAVTEAVARAPDAIALVGGDGSVGELCRAYRDVPPERRPPVVIVPAGRGNSFYKAVLSDAPWADYVRRAVDRTYVRCMDIAEVAETHEVWALGFSAGYLHDAVASTRFFPGLRGRTLYAAAGAYAAARLKPFRVEVSADGRPLYVGRSVLVALGGGPFRGGRLHLFPTSDLTDGLLDVCVVEAVGARRFADVLRAAGAGAHVEMPEVHCFQGAEITLSSPDELRCEMDGTIYEPPGGSITLRCLPAFLPVAFPFWGWDDVPPA